MATAGVDEVGRGALFGPVVAAAVILRPDLELWLQEQGVTDSKALTPKKRQHLVPRIQSASVDSQIGWVSVHRIDQINILQASLQAMRQAIGRLSPQPTQCLVDGNQMIPELRIEQKTVVKGDQSVVAIAAASIIAKVWRDTLIIRLSHRYPGYDLASNKGYGSPKHLAGLQKLGPTRYHRRSFKSCQQLSLLE
ncbi:ribonuclease HII [Leptothoe sp. ISB3NOV94-8A]|uniref:Ribonuclease HII n=1 Tax=Adonisia turfae CCMR0081 TaxID=2292702 RepID=A0A6M0RF70_9CYAN|nr:ribonuclease HII [Adonisia turfae]MDV3349426.1 ribonuclease HII [Leptothoe sp. LEGE 181152]NEZ54897.1 ribonuclease HII [Adonisia turfae CCMR0081]